MYQKLTTVFMLGVVLLSSTSLAAIPYPAALENASVDETDLIDRDSRGLVLGNGELQGVVHMRGNDISIVITKNDIWDMRINTSGDGTMPFINMATYSFPGSTTPSWFNYTYPTNTFAAEIVLTGATGFTNARLDIRRANVKINTSGSDSARIRVLSQSNVFLITTTRAMTILTGGHPVELNLPAATKGTFNGCDYFKQSIPGDADATGMDIIIAYRSSGMRHIVAVTTSRDTIDPLTAATNHCNNAMAISDADLITTHENAWDALWSKSGISLGEPNLEKWWYRMVYYMGTWASRNSHVVGLTGASPAGGGWHNSLKLNYNIQQAYSATGINNHGEWIRPLVQCFTDNWPRGQWFAKTNFYKGEGAFFNSDVYPFEPDPAKCTTKNKHQIAYTPWGYTAGMMGHLSWNFWESFKFAPDTAYLRTDLYPKLKDFAKFYCAFLENSQAGTGGYKLYGPGFWPEDENPPVANNSYDIPWTNYCLKATRQAAQILQVDADLVTRINAALAMVPPLETVASPTQGGDAVIIENWKDAGVQTYDRVGAALFAIWPTDQINIWSSYSDKQMASWTIDHANSVTTHANSTVIIPSSYSRLGDTLALSNALTWLNDGNGTFPLANGLFIWKDHGYWIAEQNAISRMIAEFLLQSVNDVVHVFPCWYNGKDARFSQLGAYGGFLVSAQKTAGVIGPVTVKSNYGSVLRFYKPALWGDVGVIHGGVTTPLTLNDSNFVSTSTIAGDNYVFVDIPFDTTNRAKIFAATATSQHPGNEASLAADANMGTYWHSEYQPSQPLPQSITFDLGSTVPVHALRYNPSPENRNGTITEYAISVSIDGTNYAQVAKGFWLDDPYRKFALWTVSDARFVRLTANAGHAGWATAGEVAIFKDTTGKTGVAKATRRNWGVASAQWRGSNLFVTMNTDEPTRLRVVSLKGEQILSTPTHGQSANYPVGQFPNGIYLLEARSQSKTQTQRLVKN